MTESIIALVLAAALAALLTPLAIRIAWATGFLDRPNSPLKTQREPVAYLGGAAIAAAFLLAVAIVKLTLMRSRGFAHWPLGLEQGRGVYAIAFGGLIALALGLLDDRRALSPGAKFVGQVLGALVLVGAGLRVRFIHQEWLSIPLTVLWVVTVTNALNFVDIMDGLAASVCAASAAVFWAFSVGAGRGNDALAAAALAGACLGFLPYNWRPARIYMGDAGSHFLGFCLAAISLNLSYSHTNALSVFSPLVILFLPLFDLALMIVIRTRKGIRPWKGSPDHTPLRLKAMGLSVPQIAALLSAMTLALGGLVYWASYLEFSGAALVWAGLAVFALASGLLLARYRMPHDLPAAGAASSFPCSGDTRV